MRANFPEDIPDCIRTCNAFPRSKCNLQVWNELPNDGRDIKVSSRYVSMPLKHWQQEQFFSKHFSACVPHDQATRESYGGWFVPCRINMFSGRKRERSPRENPPNGDLGGFSHGDLSPRQAKIRQTVAENATHGMSRSFGWWGERSPCENTKKSPFGGFSHGAFSPRKHDTTKWHKSATVESL